MIASVDGLPRTLALSLVAVGVASPLVVGIAVGWITPADLIGAVKVGVSVGLGLALWIFGAMIDPKYR